LSELAGGLDGAATFGDEVVVHIPERSGQDSLAIRYEHRPGQCDVLPRHDAEAVGGNPVVGERIAHEPGATGVGAGRRGVVDGDAPSLTVDPVREVAVPHFGSGHGAERGVAALLVVETLI